MVSLLVAASFALDPVATAQRGLDANPGAGMALSCSSFEAAAPTLTLALGAASAADDPVARLFKTPDFAKNAAGLGIDPTAPMTLVMDKAPVFARVGFNGTPAQAEALVRSLDAAATGGGVHWQLAGDFTADLRDGGFELAHPTAAGDARVPQTHTLPGVAGCAVLVDTRSKNKPVKVTAMVPFVGGGPTVAFIDLAKPPAPAMSRTDAELPLGYGEAAPDVVITVSAPLDDFLAASPSGATAMMPMLATAQTHARFPAGVTLVMHGNPKSGGSWSAMTRVVDLKGDAFPRGRLVKVLVKQLSEQKAERINKSTLSVTMKDKVLYIAFGKGGEVLMTSSLPLTKTAFDDTGVPWLSPEDEARARTATIAVTANMAKMPGSTFWMTAQGVDHALQITSQLTLEPSQRATLAMTAGMMAPMVVGMAKLQLAKVKDAVEAVPEAAPAP